MILSSPTLASIITWLPHGRSWRILQQREFEEKVIPLYFRHGRFSSFTRQVSGWGFNRITAGADFNSYYHELFLRGKPHLCHQMKRLTPKDTEQRRDSKKTGQVVSRWLIVSAEVATFFLEESSTHLNSFFTITLGTTS